MIVMALINFICYSLILIVLLLIAYDYVLDVVFKVMSRMNRCKKCYVQRGFLSVKKVKCSKHK